MTMEITSMAGKYTVEGGPRGGGWAKNHYRDGSLMLGGGAQA